MQAIRCRQSQYGLVAVCIIDKSQLIWRQLHEGLSTKLYLAVNQKVRSTCQWSLLDFITNSQGWPNLIYTPYSTVYPVISLPNIPYIRRIYMDWVGQNRIYTPYMTVYLVISLPQIPYIHGIYMVMANPMIVFLEVGWCLTQGVVQQEIHSIGLTRTVYVHHIIDVWWLPSRNYRMQ